MGDGRVSAPAGRVIEGHGHTWLVPHPRWMAWRRGAAAGAVLAGVAVAMPVAEGRSLAAGLAVVLVTLGMAAWLLLSVWRTSNTRVGVGPAGVLVQRGAHPRMLAWDAVDGIVSRPSGASGRRTRLVVDVAGDGRVEQIAWRLAWPDVERWREAVTRHAPRSETA